MAIPLNSEVTSFLDNLNHPLRNEIELLRTYILSAHSGLMENIKWNGPNYSVNREDRITIKIQPPRNIQIIFHRGAIKKEQPKAKLIHDDSGLLVWKENDRAIATFKSMDEIRKAESSLTKCVNTWVNATSLNQLGGMHG